MRLKSEIPVVFEYLKRDGWRIKAGDIGMLMTGPNGFVVLRKLSSYSDLEAALGIAGIGERYVAEAVLGVGEEVIWRYRDANPLLCTAVKQLEWQLLGNVVPAFEKEIPKRSGPTTDEVLKILHDILYGPRDRYYIS